MKKIVLLSVFVLSSLIGFSQVDKFKAMFVYQVAIQTKFTGAKASGDFVIGVKGTPGVLKMLTGLAKSKKVQGRTIVVKEIGGAGDAAGCALVYVPAGDAAGFKDACNGANTLLFSENEGTCGSGAHVAFFIADNKPKFEISESNMKAAGLTPGAKLLAMGKKV